MGKEIYKSAGRDGLLITSKGQLVIHSEKGRRKKIRSLYQTRKSIPGGLETEMQKAKAPNMVSSRSCPNSSGINMSSWETE